MEIAKEQAAIQKEHTGVEVYVSFQIGGNPRTIRWMTISEMDKLMEADAKSSADPRMIASLKKMEDVFVDGTMQDEMRYVINDEKLNVDKYNNYINRNAKSFNSAPQERIKAHYLTKPKPKNISIFKAGSRTVIEVDGKLSPSQE